MQPRADDAADFIDAMIAMRRKKRCRCYLQPTHDTFSFHERDGREWADGVPPVTGDEPLSLW